MRAVFNEHIGAGAKLKGDGVTSCRCNCSNFGQLLAEGIDSGSTCAAQLQQAILDFVVNTDSLAYARGITFNVQVKRCTASTSTVILQCRDVQDAQVGSTSGSGDEIGLGLQIDVGDHRTNGLEAADLVKGGRAGVGECHADACIAVRAHIDDVATHTY